MKEVGKSKAGQISEYWQRNFVKQECDKKILVNFLEGFENHICEKSNIIQTTVLIRLVKVNIGVLRKIISNESC